MKRFTLPRRSLRLVSCSRSRGWRQPPRWPSRGFSPRTSRSRRKSEAQMTNIDVARAWAKNYYGAPTAVAGSGATGTWDTPLNLTATTRTRRVRSPTKGDNWLAARSKVREQGDRARRRRHDADHLELRALQQLGLQPDHECHFRRPDGHARSPGTCSRPRRGWSTWSAMPRRLGYAIFWITGRGDSQHAGHDRQPGERLRGRVAGHRHRDLSGKTVPEIDAGYVTPTPINTGHGGFTDGLFTKPPVGSYPAYLDTARVLRAVHPRHPAASCPTIQYKSGHARLHRVAGLRHRRRLRRPVQRSRGWLRGQDVQDAEPELLPPVGRLAQTSSQIDGPSSEGPWSFSGLYGRTKPMRSYICSSVGADASRAFSAPTREQALELGRVGAQLLVALADRLEQRDDRLADVLLEGAVAAAVEAGLDLRDLVAGRDRHDLDQVRDAGLLARGRGARRCRNR